jgi:hypothetical protein
MEMAPLIEKKTPELKALCARYGVSRLALFGSAATGDFDPARSDLDFAVEFAPMTPVDHANAYFGLLAGLECLFGVTIDLVEIGPIRNPYLKRAIEKTQLVVHDAA